MYANPAKVPGLGGAKCSATVVVDGISIPSSASGLSCFASNAVATFCTSFLMDRAKGKKFLSVPAIIIGSTKHFISFNDY